LRIRIKIAALFSNIKSYASMNNQPFFFPKATNFEKRASNKVKVGGLSFYGAYHQLNR
jgi:hypothetical protein